MIKNKPLSDFCKELKQGFKPKNPDFSKPVKCWSEKDVLDRQVVDAFVIILQTRGCSWALNSGCSMCGYFNDSSFSKIDKDLLLKQFELAMEKYNDEPIVKIFTSGSFLDENEIPVVVRDKIIKNLFQKTQKVSVESRPEYVKPDLLKDIKKHTESKTFEVGIGLETSNDFVRENCINKGFSFSDFNKASDALKENRCDLKTYVLCKPPFITEKEAIADCVETIDKTKEMTDIFSLNPVNVQKNTVVEYLWRRNQYRPPWLWSVTEILKECTKIIENNDVLLKCDVAGGGSIRGAHNCKKCDKKFLKSISDFSIKQDPQVFEKLSCECKHKWKDQLELEDLSFGSIIDIR